MTDEVKLETIVADATLEQLTAMVVMYRDAKAGLAAQVAEIDNDVDVVKTELLRRFNEMGVESAATKEGTAYKSTKEHWRIDDWDKFFKFVVASGADAMIQKRVSTTAARAYEEEHGAAPSGLSKHVEIDINVRRN